MQLFLVVFVLACSTVQPSACRQIDDTASLNEARTLHASGSSAGQMPGLDQGHRRELLQNRAKEQSDVTAPHHAPRTRNYSQTAQSAVNEAISSTLQAQKQLTDLWNAQTKPIPTLPLPEAPKGWDTVPAASSVSLKDALSEWQCYDSAGMFGASYHHCYRSASGTLRFEAGRKAALQAVGLFVLYVLIAA